LCRNGCKEMEIKEIEAIKETKGYSKIGLNVGTSQRCDSIVRSDFDPRERGVHPHPFLHGFENKGVAKCIPASARKERGDFVSDEGEVRPKKGKGRVVEIQQGPARMDANYQKTG